MRTLLRSMTAIANDALRCCGAQIVSTATDSHYRNLQERVNRLSRDLNLIATTAASSRHPSPFANRWQSFLIEHVNRDDSLSGHGQDLFALFCLGDQQGGYFVEFGAYDGLFSSNTYLLEKIGWKGLLIEPLKGAAEICRKNRTADVIHGAVDTAYRGDGFIEIIQAGSKSASSIEAEGGISHAKDLQDDDYRIRRRALEEGRVERSPLLNLHELISSRTEEVDFMTIDVEGAEAPIVEGFDFSRFPVKVVCVEHNWRQADIDRLDSVFACHRYRRVLHEVSSRDGWYIRDDVYTRLNAPLEPATQGAVNR